MHTTEFPVSTPMMVVWAICLAVAVFFFVRLLNNLLRKNRRGLLALSFAVLLLLGAAVHAVILAQSSHTVTDGNWIQLVLVSLVAGLEMFIGHSVVFDDIIAAVVFHEPGLLLAYLTIFLLILSFSIVMVFQVLPRRLRDRIWLRTHTRFSSVRRKNHIFVGVTPSAKLLAKSILEEWNREKDKSGQGYVVFIDLPESEGVHTEISFGDIFASIVSRRKEVSLDEELGSSRFVLLKAQAADIDRSGDLADAVGMKRLRGWLHNDRTSVYILGREEENMNLLDRLLADPAVTAKIFCLSDRIQGPHSVYSAARGRVRLVDTHHLAVQQVKFQKPELHPFHFVDLAKDAEGRPLGYVSSEFHVLNVGFRETGQEYLRFLYEFGSFVGKDKRRVATTFDIFDDDLDCYRGDFLNRYPGLRNDPAFIWNDGAVGSDLFWLRYAGILGNLNYAVVSTGKPDRNLEIATRMLEVALRAEKDLSRFVIMLRVGTLDERTRGIIDFFNRTYGSGGTPVLRPFGMAEEIWNLPTISGTDLKEKASHFYAALQQAIGQDDTWEARHRRLAGQSGDPERNRMELMRMQGQDLSRSAFLPTLISLAGADLQEAAFQIPSSCEKGHYPVDGPEFCHLEYLAAQEHMRWTASHLASGYLPGPRDELLKRLPDLKPYDEVKDLRQEHNDWMVVKTVLTEVK